MVHLFLRRTFFDTLFLFEKLSFQIHSKTMYSLASVTLEFHFQKFWFECHNNTSVPENRDCFTSFTFPFISFVYVSLIFPTDFFWFITFVREIVLSNSFESDILSNFGNTGIWILKVLIWRLQQLLLLEKLPENFPENHDCFNFFAFPFSLYVFCLCRTNFCNRLFLTHYFC